MTANPPDKSPGPISAGKPLEPVGTTPQSPKGFQSYMQGATSPQQAQPAGAAGPTPMDITRGASFQTAGPNFDTMIGQAQTARDTLGTVEKQLNTPNLKLRRSQSHLLKNKLTDAQSYIRQAGAKIGVDAPPMKMPPGADAIARFIAYVNDGQNQLVQVQQKLKEMSAKGQQLNAAEMLSVTVKMNLAQQEIEYSSTLLGKVVDSIKQIMNIQL